MNRRTFALLAVATVIFAGCSATGDGGASGASESPTGAVGADLSPAWAAEIDRILAETDNATTKAVLADQTITDAELEEVRQSFRTCVAPVGITEVTFSLQGQIETNTPAGVEADAINEALNKCGKETGYDEIAPLYGQMIVNPTFEDSRQLEVDCFIRHGLVEASYTVSDYDRDQGMPLSAMTEEAAAAFNACLADPRS